MVFQISLPYFFAAYPGFSGNEAVDQLHRSHLERKNRNRNVKIHGNVARHGKHKSRFSHTRPCGNHDHVGILPARRNPVQRRKTGRNAAHTVDVFLRFFNVFNGDFQDVAHLGIIFPDVALGHGKQILLSPVEQFKYVGAFLIRLADRIGRDADEFPQNVLLRDNPCVKLNICRTCHTIGQKADVIRTAYQIKLAPFAQFCCDSQNVNGFRLLKKVLNGVKNLLVGVAVK